MIYAALIGSIIVFLMTMPRRNLLLDPLTLFFVGLLYYGYFIPVTMTILGRYEIAFLDTFVVVSDSEINKIAYMLFFGHLAFVFGYRIFTPKNFIDEKFDQSKVGKFKYGDNGGKVLALMMFSTILLCLVFYRPQLFSLFSGYAGKIETRYEQSTFAFLYGMALVSGSVMLARFVLFSKNYLIYTAVAVVFAFGWSLLTFSKEPMVFGALVLFAGAARFAPRRQLPMFGAAILAGVLVLLFFVPAFSMYRVTGRMQFVDPSSIQLSFLFSDAAGPFPAFVLAVRGGEAFQLNSLWESLFLWIPRGLWPDRPLDAAEDFARAVMPGWRPGYGLGFSPFAEGRIRFGLVFGPLLLFLSGFSISGLQRLSLRLVPASLATALLLVVQGHLMFVMHRTPFSGIFTSMAQFWLPFLLLTGLLAMVIRPRSPGSGRGQTVASRSAIG